MLGGENQILVKSLNDEEIYKSIRLIDLYTQQIKYLNLYQALSFNQKTNKPEWATITSISKNLYTDIYYYDLGKNIEISLTKKSCLIYPNRCKNEYKNTKKLHDMKKYTYICLLNSYTQPIIKILNKIYDDNIKLRNSRIKGLNETIKDNSYSLKLDKQYYQNIFLTTKMALVSLY
jgi:hypothetical protein